MSTPEQDPIRQGVIAAFASDGYLREDGARDLAKVRQRLTEILCADPVRNWTERKAGRKLITRGALVQAVFPSVVIPEDQKDPVAVLTAERVWKEIDKYLWSQVTPGSRSQVQKAVQAVMGNGYVLCRGTVAKGRAEACYVTHDWKCINADFLMPRSASVAAKVMAFSADEEMLVQLQPDHGPEILRRHDEQMKSIQATARDRLRFAIEAAQANGTEQAAPEQDADDDAGEAAE